MKIRVVVLALSCLAPSLVLAQRLTKETIYLGGMEESRLFPETPMP